MNATPSPRNPLAVLDAIRPTPDLDQLWPADQRADTLQQILATTPDTSPAPTKHAPTTAGRVVPLRTRTRVAVAAGLTAVAASAAIFGVLPGTEVPEASAFAGYQLAPTPLSAGAQDEQAQSCRDDLLGQPSSFTPAQRAELGAAPLVAADARGGWQFTVLAAPDPDLGVIGVYCLNNPDVSLDDQNPELTYTGATEGPRPDLVAPLAPDALQNGYGFGYYLTSGEGALGEFGRVGSDVTDVTLTFPGGAIVQATVQNGWYAAWWPTGDVAGIAPGDYPHTYTITTPAGPTILNPSAQTEPASDAPPSEEYGQRMADCLHPLGFDVTVNREGNGYGNPPGTEDQPAFTVAVDLCLQQTGYA